MKKLSILCILAAAALMVSCGTKAKKVETVEEVVATEVVAEEVPAVEEVVAEEAPATDAAAATTGTAE